MLLDKLVSLVSLATVCAAATPQADFFKQAFLPLRTNANGARSGSQTDWNRANVLPDLKAHATQNVPFKPDVHQLETLRADTFATLRHDAYPKHSVRVKKSKFCDGDVDAYTGYIDIEARHLFFYFFESRSNPDKDDVVFWTNGGPGASSATGLFAELGPCLIKDANSTTYNPYSWNENANLIFIDQPVGVGFSYADHGEAVATTEQDAVDIAAFVFIFFEHFSKFKGRPFHMTGESYAGRYLPVFASNVFDLNTRLVEGNYTPINLASLAIGNGLTDFLQFSLSTYDMQCTPASLPPIQTIKACVRMKQALPRCERLVKEACVDRFDDIDCAAADLFCSAQLIEPFYALGRDRFDISKDCNDGSNGCSPYAESLEAYLSKPSIQDTLGIDPAKRGNFSLYGEAVALAFDLTLDVPHASPRNVAALLERGVRILIYAGDYDFACNWVGQERWTRALDWTRRDGFAEAQLRPWKVDGEVAGITRSFAHFTFATVKGAGHLVPMDKPKESLALLQRWLAGHDL